MSDPTNPAHYRQHPSGVECITITEHMNFNLGNAMKYIWRAGLKDADALADLRKAAWYVEREIARLSTQSCPGPTPAAAAKASFASCPHETCLYPGTCGRSGRCLA